MKYIRFAILLTFGLLANISIFAQVTSVAAGYEIVNTFTLPANLVSPPGSIIFSSDGNTVYILDESETTTSGVSSASVTRDADGNVTGFGTFSQVFAHASMDTGLRLDNASGTFFFAMESNGLGQRLTNSTIETTAVSPYDDANGGLGFIPSGKTFAGDIVAVSYSDGKLYRHSVAADGDGSFTINGTGTLYADFSASVGTSIIGDIAFLTSGPLAGNALLTTYGDTNSIVYFPIDSDGLPAEGSTPTPRIFASGNSGAWGISIDPFTGNIWLTDYDETNEVAFIQVAPEVNNSFCIPVKTANNAVAVICM